MEPKATQVHDQSLLGGIEEILKTHIEENLPNEVSGIIALADPPRIINQRVGNTSSVVSYGQDDVIKIYFDDACSFVKYHSHPSDNAMFSSDDCTVMRTVEKWLVLLSNFESISPSFLKSHGLKRIYDKFNEDPEMREKLIANPSRKKQMYNVLGYQSHGKTHFLIYKIEDVNLDTIMHRDSMINRLRLKVGKSFPFLTLPISKDDETPKKIDILGKEDGATSLGVK